MFHGIQRKPVVDIQNIKKMGNHNILLKKNIINKKLKTGKMKLEEKKKLFNKIVIFLMTFYIDFM